MSIKQSTFILIFCLIFASNNQLHSQTKNKNDEVKLGLVLSGGGAKGFAHIGVLKVLEEENIPITIISGNSIGTIVGALYSIGYSAQDIEDFVREQDWEMLLFDRVPRKLKSPFKQDFEQKYLLQLSLSKEDRKLSLPSGFVRGNNILNLFKGITANIPDSIHFSDLPIPFACVAYNLETGKEEVLSQGNLSTAMLSSMAIPGAFSPVNFNDMHLVDGGIINNFPVDVAIDMGADIIIGVDLHQEKDKSSQFESFTSILMGIVNKIEEEKHNNNIELADVVINPELKGVALFDFKASAVDSIMKKGEMAAREQLPKIRELVAGRNIKRNNDNLEYNHNDQWLIKEVIIPQGFQNDSRFINSRLNLSENTTYTTKEIEEAAKRVYAYGNYEMVSYKLMTNDNGHNLELIIKDKKEAKVMFGAALNTVDLATLYANLSKQNNSNLISLVTIDAKIAVNPQLSIKMETHRMLYSALGLEIDGRFNKLNHYQGGHRFGKVDVVNASATLYSYRRYHNTVDMGFGLSQNYFNSNAYSNNPSNLLDATSNGFYSTLYGHIKIDSRDDAYIPTKGFYLNTKFSFLVNKGDFSDIIPIYHLKLNSVAHIGHNLFLYADLYHRSIFNSENQTSAFANYAANTYNSYSDYSFPVLGQRGISFLEPISTLGELGLRIELFDKNYLTPRVQGLLQFEKWDKFDFDNLNWSAGLTYQTTTRFGPVDFTLGYQNEFSDFNFFGGIGYQF